MTMETVSLTTNNNNSSSSSNGSSYKKAEGFVQRHRVLIFFLALLVVAWQTLEVVIHDNDDDESYATTTTTTTPNGHHLDFDSSSSSSSGAAAAAHPLHNNNNKNNNNNNHLRSETHTEVKKKDLVVVNDDDDDDDDDDPTSPQTSIVKKNNLKKKPNDSNTTITTLPPVATTAVGEEVVATNPPPPPSFVHINDQPFDPPLWLQDYLDFHRTTVKWAKNKKGGKRLQMANPNFPWIQWYCKKEVGQYKGTAENGQERRRCGGIGDRLKGMMNIAMHAVMSHRTFLIEEWSSPEATHPLIDYLEPNLMQWHAVKSGKTERGRIKTYKSLNDEEKCFVTNDGVSNKVGLRFRSTFFEKEQTYIQSKCFRRKFWKPLQDKYDDGFQIPGRYRLFLDMFHTLFRFSHHVRHEANRLRGPQSAQTDGTNQATLRASPVPVRPLDPEWYLGVHIRTGNGTSWNDPLRHSSEEDWHVFAKCSAAFATAMQEKCPGTPLPVSYVASDNAAAKEYMRQHDYISRNANVTDTSSIHLADIPIYHVDRSATSQYNNVTAAYVATFGEFKVLMDSTCLINSDSGFSILARHLSRAQPRCFMTEKECAALIQTKDDPVGLRKKVAERTQNLVCPGEAPPASWR